MQIAFAISRSCDYCNLATVVAEIDGRDIKFISEYDLSYLFSSVISHDDMEIKCDHLSSCDL